MSDTIGCQPFTFIVSIEVSDGISEASKICDKKNEMNFRKSVF